MKQRAPVHRQLGRVRPCGGVGGARAMCPGGVPLGYPHIIDITDERTLKSSPNSSWK